MIDFFEAWRYLEEHEYYHHPEYGSSISAFPASLCVEVVKVNPDTLEIDDDDELNTKTRVWIESGSWLFCKMAVHNNLSHDWKLDTGGDTFEEAIINLRNIIDDCQGIQE